MPQMFKVSGVATSIKTENNFTKMFYHNTPVVSFNSEVIILNTGGWFTNTTKTRMNQASNQFNLGFDVYQKKGVWYVDFRGETLKFVGETIELKR